jgi:hypothetical protein
MNSDRQTLETDRRRANSAMSECRRQADERILQRVNTRDRWTNDCFKRRTWRTSRRWEQVNVGNGRALGTSEHFDKRTPSTREWANAERANAGQRMETSEHGTSEHQTEDGDERMLDE